MGVASVLLVTAGCDDHDVGESWVTMQWVRRLADRHDVTVLNQHKSGAVPLSRQLPDARVVEWEQPAALARLERFNSLLKPGYVPFYRAVRRWVRESSRRGDRFDLAHQLSPVAMRYPSALSGCGLPYVIGPVGGSLTSPPAFGADESGFPWYMALRRVDTWRLAHDAVLRRSFGRAECVLGIGTYVEQLLGGVSLRRFEVVNDSGVESMPSLPDPATRRAPGPVRLLFVGRVIRTKGVRDAIRALSLVRSADVVFDVVGDGYDLSACRDLTAELGLQRQVEFHGRVPHGAVAEFYRRADVFLFPSYREPGGIVVSEAMSFGLPVIACDRGGPATTLDASSGIMVAAESPDQYARDLASAISTLVDDPAGRRAMGDAARNRIAEHGLWDRKVDALDRLYGELIATCAA